MADWRPAAELIHEQPRVSPRPSESLRILIIDDDAATRELVKLQISDISGNIETADSVHIARELLTSQGTDQFSCIISDYTMPEETGLGLVAWLKQIDSSLEVILLTARNDKETLKKALRLGIFDFLEKPISGQELIRTLLLGIQKTTANRQQSSERYEIGHRIGSGGSGSVYEAWDCHLDRKVAFKRLHTGEAECLVEEHTLIEEALRLAKLQHPHIVNVFDCGTDSHGPFMVMELLEGETLHDMIDSDREFSPENIHRLVYQCLDALDYAHNKRFIHMDLKPSNIINVHLHGKHMHIKLLDFGISCIMGNSSENLNPEDEFILGSPTYMAPERFLSNPLDGRCDLYSLGCVLYHVISGIEPFLADSHEDIASRHYKNDIRPLHKVTPNAGRKLSGWVHRLLRPLPDDRPQSAAAAKEAFLRLFPHPK